MKIDKENMEHIQEILDKYGVSGLNDLDQRLFEWGEENAKMYEVEVTRPVTFRLRVMAVSADGACVAGNRSLDEDPKGPNSDHGNYTIHPHAFYDTERMTTHAKEVEDA